MQLPRRGALAALPLLLTASLALAPAGAAPMRLTAARTSRPADDFEAASRAEQAAVAAVTGARAERQRLEADVAALDTQVVAAASRARSTAADLARVQRALHNVAVRVVRSQRVLDAARARARTAAATIYRRSGSAATTAFANLGARSVRDAVSRRHYMGVVGDRLTEDIDAVRVANDDVESALRSLKQRRASATRAAASARHDAEAVAATRAGRRRLLDRARAVEARESVALAAAQARRAEFERAAEAAREASRSVQDTLRARPGRGSGSGRLRFPADGPISSPFGERMHPIFHEMRMHTGIDIGAGYGAPVHAAASGVVVTAGVITGYGNAVVVDHGGGLATLYGHLSRFAVRTGQNVDVGQTLGAVGNTGNSTGPHLHFEVRVRGVPVDPMGYL